MKRIVSIMLLLITLCLAGCNTPSPSTEVNTPSTSSAQTSTSAPTTVPTQDKVYDIWQGVEGDIATLEVPIGSAVIELNKKDGSATMYTVYDKYTTAKDYGFEQYDAEMGAFKHYYGTYKIENGNVIFTFNLTQYIRMDVRGKDSEEFKNAYINYIKTEFPQREQDIINSFDKGYPSFATESSSTMVMNYNGEYLQVLELKSYKDNSYLESVTKYNSDGSSATTVYFENGNVYQLEEYSKDGKLTKRTLYTEDGKIEYTQTNTVDENGTSITIRVDADGKEFYRHELSEEKYSGGTKKTYKTTQNGIVTNYKIDDYRDNGINVFTEENLDGNTKQHSVFVDGGIQGNEYSLSELYVDSQLANYTCTRYFDDRNVYCKQISYSQDSGFYHLTITYTDGRIEDTDIPASEYQKADWEIFN